MESATEISQTKTNTQPAKQESWWDRIKPKFSFDTLSDSLYFTRMFMYQFEATYDYFVKKIADLDFIKDASVSMRRAAKKFVGRGEEITIESEIRKTVLRNVPGSKNNNKFIEETFVERVEEKIKPLQDNWKSRIMGVLPFTRDIPGMRQTKEGKIRGTMDSTKLYFGQSKPQGYPSEEAQAFLFSRNLMNVFEALVFGTMDYLGYRKHRNELVDDLRDTIHLEHSKIPKSSVDIGNVRDSTNPFIKSEISLTNWKYGSRILGDLAFVWGLKTGIILKLLPYPLEYTVFKQPTAFRSLRKAITDVQNNELDMDVEKNLIIDIQRGIEQCLKDNKLPKMASKEMNEYKEPA